MDVEGLGTGKDFKLYPGGGRAWDWKETGTGHTPGIQLTDIAELLQRGAKVVVLSCGIDLLLEVKAEVVETLEKQGISVHVAQTEEAVRIYNKLAEAKQPVGGLFHSTC
jgi:hypothetical protein